MTSQKKNKKKICSHTEAYFQRTSIKSLASRNDEPYLVPVTF